MTRSAPASVSIQTSLHSSPAPPPWFGEVALLVSHLQKQGVLDALSAHVRFARRRFGTSRSSILSRCSSGILSVANGRCKPSTKECGLGPAPSWPSSSVAAVEDFPERLSARAAAHPTNDQAHHADKRLAAQRLIGGFAHGNAPLAASAGCLLPPGDRVWRRQAPQ